MGYLHETNRGNTASTYTGCPDIRVDELSAGLVHTGAK